MAFHACCYYGISFRLFRFQVEEDNSAQYRKYHFIGSNTGISKSDRVAVNSCDNACHSCHPLPKNRPLFASAQRVKADIGWINMKIDTSY